MKKIIAILVLSCFLIPQLAFAGAWTLPKNNVWAEQTLKKLWAKYDYDSQHHMARKGNDARSWGWAAITKVEYGLFDWLTLLSGFEYKEGHYKEYDRNPTWGPYDTSNHAFTSFRLGAKARLLKDPVVLSIQAVGEWYTGGKSYTDPIPGSSTYGPEDRPGLSDGNDSLELRVLVGKKWDTAIPFYLGAETGYRFKNRNVCSDIPFLVEGGFWPTKWLLLKSEVDGYWCNDGTGSIEKEYAVWRIGPVFQILDIIKSIKGETISTKDMTDTVTLQGRSLNLEVQYGNTFWGRNTSADQEIVVKVSGQF